MAQSLGLTVNSSLTAANLLGTGSHARPVPEPTQATLNNPAAISTTLINNQLAETKGELTALAPLFPSLANRVDDHPPTTDIYGYDPNGNLLIHSDENNSYIYTQYDAIDRPIAVRVFRAGQHDAFTADPIFAPHPSSLPTNHPNPAMFQAVVGTTIANFQYDGLSRMTSAYDNNDPTNLNSSSTVTDAYDSLGRVIEETQQIGFLPAQATDSAWRADDLRKSLTYPNGRVEQYTYDSLDRLQTVTDQGASQPLVVYHYIGVDRVLERDYPQSGTRETYLDDTGTVDIGYDGDRRPIELRDLRSDNSLIVGFTYTYDRMDNTLTEGKLHNPANSETYTYDSAYRLVTFNRAAGGQTPIQSTWSLDGVGNWKQVNGETRQYSSTNELIQRQHGSTTTNLKYDDNGNEIDDGTYHYTYDALNRLRTVTRDSDAKLIAVYSYDALGRRIRKVVTNSGSLNGTTDFYYDGVQDIEEHNAANALTQQYVYGAGIDEELVLDRNLNGDGTATGSGDQRLYYYQNALGSVFALTDTTGAIREAYQYDAYGRQTVYTAGSSGVVVFGPGDVVTPGGVSAVANPFTFTGQRLDPETVLMYYKNRYYSTALGRFISRDPIGYWGAANGSLYEYVAGAPTNWVDPLGWGKCCEHVNGLGKLTQVQHYIADCCSGEDKEVAMAKCAGLPGAGGGGVGVGIAAGGGGGVAQPSFIVSLIPVIGPAWSAYAYFQNGQTGLGLLYTGIAILDTFLVANAVDKIAAEGLGGFLVKGAPKGIGRLIGFSEAEAQMIANAEKALQGAGYDASLFKELVRSEMPAGYRAMSLEGGATLGKEAFASQELLNHVLEEELIHLQQKAAGLAQKFGPGTAAGLEGAANAARKFPAPK
jgi:RHS repeat-associated protein